MKKLLAMLLALMMLQLPVLSMAENFDDLDDMIGSSEQLLAGDEKEEPAAIPAQGGRRTNTVLSIKELTGIPISDATISAAIDDLLAALGIRFSHQDNEGEMAVVLSGQDVLTLGGAVEGEEIYLSSNLLGGVIAVSAEDIIPLVYRFLDVFVQMGIMTERDAEEAKAVIEMAQEEMESSMNASMDYVMQLQDLQNLDFSALEKAVMIIAGKVEMVSSPVVPRMCDAADSGISVTLNNEEFVEIIRACIQFVMDNPVIKQYMEATGEFYTEEEVAEMWAYYQKSGLNETEEQFRSRHATVDMALQNAMDSLEGATCLGGDLTFALYVSNEGYPVYSTFVLPMYDGEQTDTLESVYTRQTVAQGVAHTCSMTVDGETVTIDALATDESTVINLIAANGMKTMDIIITNVGENALKAEMNAYEGNRYKETNDKLFTLQLDGQWKITNAKFYLDGKLNFNTWRGNAVDENAAFALKCDYTASGEDFSGATEFSFQAEGVGLTIQAVTETTEAETSIMDGNVTRLAELSDMELQNWINSIVEGLNTVLGTAIIALPESVLMLLISSGMM